MREYETRVATVRGLSFDAAKQGSLTPGLEAAFRDAVDELQTGGGGDLVGISGNCGFMMFYQELVRGLAGVPVFMSPLLQAPLVAGALPPSGIILVLTASGDTARQVEGTLRGTISRVMGSMIGTDSILLRAADLGKEFGWVKPGDALVAIHGMLEARSGATNMLKVIVVD